MAKLYFVGTPIGNLADITLRALSTLALVDIIACEDTRQARVLLEAHNISHKKLISHHAFNEQNSALGIIELVKAGQNVALISDAGMPGVSDPGYLLLKAAIKDQVEYEVIPGVSAVTMTSLLANIGSDFSFHGFLKPKSGQRQNQLKKFLPGAHIIFVAPHQIKATLEDLKAVFGAELNVFIGRELTKKFESHYRGTVIEVQAHLNTLERGEITLAFRFESLNAASN